MKKLCSKENDVFGRWRDLKKAYEQVRKDFEKDSNSVVIPIESWIDTAQNVASLITEASELLAEIPQVVEGSRKLISNLAS